MSTDTPYDRFTEQLRDLQTGLDALLRAGQPGDPAAETLLGAIQALGPTLRDLQAAEGAGAEAERQYYHALFDTAPDAYLITDARGLIRTANQAAARLLNVDADHLRGKLLPLYFGPDGRRGLRQRLSKVLGAALPLAWEDQLQPLQQAMVEVAVSVSPMGQDEAGQPQELRWRLHNIAERRQSQQALRDSEERYHRLLHASLEAIYLYDAFTRRLLEANPAFLRMLGYTAAEVQDLTLYDIAANDRPSIEQYWRQVMAGGPVDMGERRWRRKDGQPVDVHVTASKIRQGERDIIAVIGRDISAHKAAEAQLRESEARFRRLAENAPDIIYRFRLGSQPGYEYISPAVKALLGFTPEEFYADAELGLRQTHPDDRMLLSGVLDDPARTGQLLKVRRLHRDGRLVWTEQRPVILCDENGQPVAVEGIIRDITAQKRSEDEQARSAALISALSQVAAQLQDKLEPDEIIATMGAELVRFEITCVVLLTDAEGGLAVRHVSLDAARLAQAKAALGVPLPGYRFPLERLPEYKALWVERRPVYVDHVIPLAAAVLGGVSEAAVRGAFQAHGLREDTRGVCAPLVAEKQPLGLLLMWGLNLNHTDLPAVSVFAGQVSSALENARLFEAERDQRALAEALRQTAELLNSTLEYEQVLDQILLHAETLLHYDLALITMMEADGYFSNKRSRGYDKYGLGEYAGQIKFALVEFPLLGALVASGQAMHLADAHAHADWVKVPETAWVRSQVIAPLRMKGKVMGFISLSSARVGFYTEADAPRLQALADQAAVALENAMLFEQLRSGREQLQALSQRLLEVQETERRLIARELHDEIGQALTGLKLFIEAGYRAPQATASAKLETAHSLVDELISRVRDLSLDLRPTMLDDLGLVPALLWQFERYTAQTGIRVRFQHFGLDRRFGPDLETAAYRIVQEALTNVARHAGTEEATVNLWADAATLNVQVEDQGTGFDPVLMRGSHPSSGLAGMIERATLLNGQLTVEAAPGAGTQITAELPVRQ